MVSMYVILPGVQPTDLPQGFLFCESTPISLADPYNPTTTATLIICQFGKISHSISPAKEGGYAKGTERRTFSMTNSRPNGPTTLSSCRPLDVCQVTKPLWLHHPIVDTPALPAVATYGLSPLSHMAALSVGVHRKLHAHKTVRRPLDRHRCSPLAEVVASMQPLCDLKSRERCPASQGRS